MLQRFSAGLLLLLVAYLGAHAQNMPRLPESAAAQLDSALARQGAVDQPLSGGFTPLTLAAASANTRALLSLIAKGANLNTPEPTTGYTPLMRAVQASAIGAIEVLLKKGADPNRSAADGLQAIDFAVQPSLIAMLQNAGARPSKLQRALKAIDNGDDMALNAALAEGLNPNVANAEGATLIGYAAANGNLEAVRTLQAAGAPIESRGTTGFTPLMVAARFGHLPTVQYLSDQGADINARGTYLGYTPLIMALLSNNDLVIDFLLTRKADPKIRTTDGYSTLDFTQDTVTALRLLRLGARPTYKDPYLRAVRKGQIDSTAYWLSLGAEIDTRSTDQNKTALMLASRASQARRFDLVKLLVTKGANLNLLDDFGQSALNHAVQAGNPRLVKYLISKGAIPDNPVPTTANTGQFSSAVPLELSSTPLIDAVRLGRRDIAEVLIKGGAKVDHPDVNGLTPLAHAARLNNLKMARLLLRKGARVEQANTDNQAPPTAQPKTALEFARAGNYTEIINLLQRHGAR